MKNRELLDHMESDGSVSIETMRGRARELASALDAAERAKHELLQFVSSIAHISNGKIRVEANKLLAENGLPTVPLSQ